MANLKTKYSVSIDLTKIDKNRIVKTDKNGVLFENKAQYYSIDIVVFDAPNQYGSDVMIVEGQTKEERDNKVKSKPIGNGKTVFTANPAPQGYSNQPNPSYSQPSATTPPPPPQMPSMGNGEEDDLPF